MTRACQVRDAATPPAVVPSLSLSCAPRPAKAMASLPPTYTSMEVAPHRPNHPPTYQQREYSSHSPLHDLLQRRVVLAWQQQLALDLLSGSSSTVCIITDAH